MSTINLPTASLKTILDVDNRNVIIPVEEAINFLNSNKEKEKDKATGIRTMFAAPEEYGNTIEYNYDIAFINKINEYPITLFNTEVKYWNILFKYYNDISIEFLVPGFVKFWSQNNKTFVPVEFMKKSDLLIDYKGDMVQVVKKTELTDINLENDKYYNIIVNSSSQEYCSQFYLNGILTSISYNNYTKD